MTNKRVCVVNNETRMIMRVSREYAVMGVQAGMLKYTTKSALKKFMNRDVQLSKNERFVKAAYNNERHKWYKHGIFDFKSLGGRLYYLIGANKTHTYSNQYGGRKSQVLVKQY